MKTLGFIGTGGMGSGMAGNLIKAGHRLVVNDLRREVARNLESRGAEFRESPKAVAEGSEVVLSMLPYNEAVREVGLGKGGLHEAASGARLWIDFSSIDKKTISGRGYELAQERRGVGGDLSHRDAQFTAEVRGGGANFRGCCEPQVQAA